MKSNIYSMLENFFDNDIISIAKELNYAEENIVILEDNIEKLKNNFPEMYENLKSCKYKKDGRTEIEYAQDLVCSWIFEDYLITNLKKCGLKVELSGSDFERKILKSSKVKASSDYMIKYNNNTAFIELVNDYKGYWLANKKGHLRDDKYIRLKELGQQNSFSLLLGIDFTNKKFFLININEYEDKAKYIPYHFPYRKPAYEIDLHDTEYYEFTFKKICDEIIKLFNK